MTTTPDLIVQALRDMGAAKFHLSVDIYEHMRRTLPTNPSLDAIRAVLPELVKSGRVERDAAYHWRAGVVATEPAEPYKPYELSYTEYGVWRSLDDDPANIHTIITRISGDHHDYTQVKSTLDRLVEHECAVVSTDERSVAQWTRGPRPAIPEPLRRDSMSKGERAVWASAFVLYCDRLRQQILTEWHTLDIDKPKPDGPPDFSSVVVDAAMLATERVRDLRRAAVELENNTEPVGRMVGDMVHV